MQRALRHTPLCLILATMALACLYFGEVIVGQRVYYAGDTARVYLPQHAALMRAWGTGTLPWWSASLGAGFPLLAEGQAAALYPPNWILHLLLPTAQAVSASIMLHDLLAGLGLYSFARTLGLSRAASFLGATVQALGGFCVAQLSHLPVISVAAWLPLMFACTHRLLGPASRSLRRRWRDAAALALIVALQFLAGHAQISLLALLSLAFYALFLTFTAYPLRASTGPALLWFAALALGALLAIPQLLPMAELALSSQRAGGLESYFFTSFSFHPFMVATYISPYVLGNPYPKGSMETMAYVGLLPLALASVALWRSPSREKWFYVVLALAGLLLSFGQWNPFYQYLRYVPVLNLFRVPARYLYWVSFSLGVLAALGAEQLLALARERSTRGGLALLSMATLALGVAVAGIAMSRCDVWKLLAAWRFLPLVFGAATLCVVLAARCAGRVLWASVACLVVFVDLYAYGGVLNLTFNATIPSQQALARPASLHFFESDPGLYRLYTKEEILPTLSVMRESHYPNLALTYDLPSANLYIPLVPRHYQEYLDSLTAQKLDRLNVKYYCIPQLLPVDALSELYDVHNPFASLSANDWLDVPPLDVTAVEIESYLSHAASLADGALAGELLLRDASGTITTIPLHAGQETAEWAYERDDVAAHIAHAMPPLASTWPSRSGFPPREHPGHTYRARVKLDAPLRLAAVMLRTELPEAFVRVERVRLQDSAGQQRLLAHLLGLGDHTIVYRSEDVIIYRNEDVLPRAYTLPVREIVLRADGLALPSTLTSRQVGAVDIVRYEDMSVILHTKVSEPAYLILADLDYPGWHATVDGQPAAISRVDGIFRGVALAPGEHVVTFAYRPTFTLR